MKHISILRLLAGGLIFTVASCSLDYNPLDTYSDVTEGVQTEEDKEAVFKDKAAVEAHLQTLYDQMRTRQEHWYQDMYLIGDTHSDNAYAGTRSGAPQYFESNTIPSTIPPLQRGWNNFMQDIARANKLICNIDAVEDASMTSQERESYKAQAQIFRAMIYFDMVRNWGSVPIVVTEAGDITSETVEDVYPAYFPVQNTEEEVYRQIEKDLLEAVVTAPNNNPADKTRFSKSVARTLLAKIYAEEPLRDYAKVIKYCDEVAADGFRLTDKFNDLFGVKLQDETLPPGSDNLAIDTKYRNTAESILEAQYFPGSGAWLPNILGRFLDDWEKQFTYAKWITPSRDLIAAFEEAGDTERFNETVVYYQTNWDNHYPREHYPFMYKIRCSYSTVIKYRYADVLLLKAEALLLGNGSVADAVGIINQVRSRAGLEALPSSASSGKEAAFEALVKERRLELALEGQRWYDLVRWGKVEEVMNSLPDRDEGRAKLGNLFNRNYYKLPISQSVLDQNPNLEQNPGY
ncbi:RagB/SusD family nutrient uptake outer membrane protein [Bacteroides sp. UBA939]|uniref:RagB/SusD family nutrient uptake outer membrane protein n=1 Tax=Bacteroides sp. UBA939 TaxID=1946092 RepID=UPI0025C45A76|nr:RagB/SusD family nutrient uptake outer membrane protein [Bacteroides sp. UBA939]